MAKRRGKSEAVGSLDSLLDTMTNVVGILVILLVVTQLGVREAVQRIGSSDAVRPELLETARNEAAAAAARSETLRLQLEDLRPKDEAESRRQLALIDKSLADALADLAALTGSRKQETELHEAKLKETQTRLEEQKREQEELRRKVTAAAERLASLKAQLAEKPEPVGPPPKLVYLPNPRPAPAGAEPLLFVCREGRIGYCDLPAYQVRAERWTSAAVQRGGLDRDKQAGVDCGALFDQFNRQEFRDVNFQLRLEARGRFPWLVLERRENFGETTEQIAEPASRYQQALRRIDKRRFYLRFLVWNDSFDTYLAARALAIESDLAAGWEPLSSSAEHSVRLAGTLRCGPPPPPNPNPRPVPQPAPPSREPPVDVVD